MRATFLSIRATLSIDHRETKVAGQTKKFVVPILEIPISLTDLLKQGVALGSVTPQVSALPQERKVAPVASVGEAPSPSEVEEEATESTGNADKPSLDGFAEKVIMDAWDRLNGLLDSVPDGTMKENETKLRQLFRTLGQVGLIEDADARLHAALAARGVAHVGELKAVEGAG